MASKYERERDRALNRAAAERMRVTSPNRMSVPATPPKPGSPDMARYLNQLKNAEAASSTPEQQMRNSETKGRMIQQLADAENAPKSKAEELKRKIASSRAGKVAGKMFGKGGKALGPLGFVGALNEAGKIMQSKPKKRRMD